MFARILPGLSEDDRELLVLIGWFELTPKEASSVMGLGDGVARVRLHRLRTVLRGELDRVEGWSS